MSYTGITIFISLFAAHLIGDFLLQTKNDVQSKNNPLIFLKHLFLLSFISYLLCGLWLEWLIPLFIFLTHGVIDLIKQIFFSSIKTDGKKLVVFLVDQLFHIAAIVFLSIYLQQKYLLTDMFWINYFDVDFTAALILISSLILLTKTGGIIIGYIVNPFLDQMSVSKDKDEENNSFRGFINGGKVIGYLERILIFIFILSGSLTAVGFLIAAKSVFRFGEVSNPGSRMEAEYIIIGTLCSFILALLISYAALNMLQQF